MPPTIVTAPATRLGDLAHGIARSARSDAARFDDDLAHATARAAERSDSPRFVIAVPPSDADDLAPLERGWLAPALALLESRGIRELRFVTDGNGGAATWTARSPAWSDRLAARTLRRPFTAPPAPER
jgi:hypothetical protein